MESANESLLVRKGERIKDLVVGAVIIAVGAYGSLSIYGTKATGFVDEQSMDHTTLPAIWGVMLVLLGGLWLAQVLIELLQINKALGGAKDGESVWNKRVMFPDASPQLLMRMAAVIVGLIAYAFTLEVVPFYLATGVFLFLMLLAFGQRPDLRTVLIAIAGAAVFHALFVMFLKLPL